MNEAKTEQEYESQPLKNFAMLMFVFRETTSLSSEFGHKHDSFVKCCNSQLLFCFCFNIQFGLSQQSNSFLLNYQRLIFVRFMQRVVQSLNNLLDAQTLPATPELHQDLVYCPSFLTLLLKKLNSLLTLLHILRIQSRIIIT